MTTLVVNINRLVWEQDSVGDALWEGKYFSGIVFEDDPVNGTVLAVVGYRFGKRHGAVREWNRAGRLLDEEYEDVGGSHGPFRKWYPNGQLAMSGYTEHSINLRSKRWAEDGKLLEEKYLLEGDPRWAKLEAERKRGPSPIIDIDLATLAFFERPEGWGRNELDLPQPQPPPSLQLCRSLEVPYTGAER